MSSFPTWWRFQMNWGFQTNWILLASVADGRAVVPVFRGMRVRWRLGKG
jgi:hypothetical protein